MYNTTMQTIAEPDQDAPVIRANIRIACAHSCQASRKPVQFGDEVELLAEDGRALFTLKLRPDGSLEVSCDSFVKMDGKILDNRLVIQPQGVHSVTLARAPYSSR